MTNHESHKEYDIPTKKVVGDEGSPPLSYCFVPYAMPQTPRGGACTDSLFRWTGPERGASEHQ